MTSLAESIVNFKYSDDNTQPATAKSLVMGGNGTFIKLNGRFATAVVKMNADTVSKALPELTESYQAHTDFPKIPLKAFMTVLAFYKWTYEQYSTEAQVNFYWNKNHVKLPKIPGVTNWKNGVVSYTPKQKNSGTLTECGDDPNYLWFRNHLEPYVETHSHHTMNAFMSGTDEANSHMDGLQLVFGKITSPEFQLKGWTTTLNTISGYVQNDIIQEFVELPTVTYTRRATGKPLETWEEVDFTSPELKDLPTIPKSWLKQQAKPVVPVYRGGAHLPGFRYPVKTNYGAPIVTTPVKQPAYSWTPGAQINDDETQMPFTKQNQLAIDDADTDPAYSLTDFPDYNPEELDDDQDYTAVPRYYDLTPVEQDDMMRRLGFELECLSLDAQPPVFGGIDNPAYNWFGEQYSANDLANLAKEALAFAQQ